MGAQNGCPLTLSPTKLLSPECFTRAAHVAGSSGGGTCPGWQALTKTNLAGGVDVPYVLPWASLPGLAQPTTWPLGARHHAHSPFFRSTWMSCSGMVCQAQEAVRRRNA